MCSYLGTSCTCARYLFVSFVPPKQDWPVSETRHAPDYPWRRVNDEPRHAGPGPLTSLVFPQPTSCPI